MNKLFSFFLFSSLTPLLVKAGTAEFTTPSVRTVQVEGERVFVYGTPGFVTTIEFPEPIASVKSAYVTSDPKTDPGDWMRHFTPGSKYLTVMPLKEDAKIRSMNVVTASGVTVVMLNSDRVQVDALVHLHFPKKTSDLAQEESDGNEPAKDSKRPVNQAKSAGAAAESGYSVSSVPPKVKRRPADPARMLGFLDKVKLIALQPVEKRPALLATMDGVTVSERKNDTTDFDSYRFIMKTVVRDDKMDALAFHFVIENRTRYKLHPNPESAWARCGDMAFRQSLPDLPVEVPALGSAEGFFIIQGDGEGGTNKLRADNVFTIGMEMGVGEALPAVKVREKAQEIGKASKGSAK